MNVAMDTIVMESSINEDINCDSLFKIFFSPRKNIKADPKLDPRLHVWNGLSFNARDNIEGNWTHSREVIKRFMPKIIASASFIELVYLSAHAFCH